MYVYMYMYSKCTLVSYPILVFSAVSEEAAPGGSRWNHCALRNCESHLDQSIKCTCNYDLG